MKTLLIILFFGFASLLVSAQEVLSSAGETKTISGIEISWTIGEPVIETISSGSTVLTQGFHQSKLTVTAIAEPLYSDVGLKVYPNPTQDFVTIHFDKLPSETAYSLFDINGKLLEQNNIATNNVSLNMSNFASGSYLLKLNRKNQQPLKTFKIIKR